MVSSKGEEKIEVFNSSKDESEANEKIMGDDHQLRNKNIYRLLYPCATKRWPALTPFYVGKGDSRRPEDHIKGAKIYLSDVDFERQVEHQKNPFKLRIIRNILKSGQRPLVEYPFTDLTNDEANALEISEIARIGRFDRRLGPLTNLTDGGEGTKGYRMKEETKKKLREYQANPDTKEFMRIKHRALYRFPEIKEKHRLSLIKSNAQPSVKANRAYHYQKFRNFHQNKRDLIAAEVLRFYLNGWTVNKISCYLKVPYSRVKRIVEEMNLISIKIDTQP